MDAPFCGDTRVGVIGPAATLVKVHSALGADGFGGACTATTSQLYLAPFINTGRNYSGGIPGRDAS